MKKKLPLSMLLGISVALWDAPLAAQQMAEADPEFDELLSLDIADLSVTSVSKRSQKLTETAAAIYVVTQEDIRRSGAYTIPDALRLVPGVQVARVSSNRWAISARGFNNPLANKLLVLIDGRSIYTPVFSGVYWDDQSTLIEDVDRIEVIRGPGASLYGVNAVNGVINIITKKAQDTQGNLVSVMGTARGSGLAEGRHGGRINENTYYRAYATYLDFGQTGNTNGTSNRDDWYRARTGFRMDTDRVNDNEYTLQGDMYYGRQGALNTLAFPNATTLTLPFDSTSVGGNVLGRWTRHLDKDSQLMLQGYLDHYTRREVNATQQVTTADMQLQHTLALDERNNFIWGGGVRGFNVVGEGSYALSVNEEHDNHYILSTFLQDEYAVVPEKLYLTLGSKLEYYDLSGLVVEPSARLAWHITENQTVWGAVSRAVRTPSIIEKDINLLAAFAAGPTERRLAGSGNQKSEELIAYEIGHRIQPIRSLSFDTALFYNDYDKLQTIGTPLPAFLGPNGNFIQFFPYNNLGSGHAYGVEFAANWNVTPDWRLAGSYTYTKLDLDNPANVTVSLEGSEALTPRHQAAIQSYYNLSETVHWDNMLYYVSKLSTPADAYLRYDMRVAWLAAPGLELSLIGRNLLDPKHVEYPGTPSTELSRSVVGQVLWKF